MQKFDSITQYNKKFDQLFTNVNQKGYACGFFSVLTANTYLKYGLFDLPTHENNIEEAIKYTVKKKIVGGVNFDNLLEMTTNLNKNNIMATSVELINAGVLSYPHIFDNSDNVEKYAIIFLKNEKYFVVMFDKTKNQYYLRDCHESSQYTYNSLDDLVKRLDEAYQFGTDIGLVGDEYIAYSSIEFIRITQNFQQKITEGDKYIEKKDQILKKKLENDMEEEKIKHEILKKKIDKQILEDEQKNELTVNFSEIIAEDQDTPIKEFVCEEDGFFIL
jgi:hypothetical protein